MHQRADLGDSGAAWEDRGAQHRQAVVFVHGWGGHFEDTWTWRPPRWWRLRHPCTPTPPSQSLFDLLLKKQDLAWDIYSMMHPAGPLSAVSVRSVAQQLRSFLANHVRADSVALVAHSLGGLACRQAVLDMLELGDSHSRVEGLLLYGTPNTGTQVARYGRRYGRSLAAGDMEPFSRYLTELNQDWTRRVVNGGDPDCRPNERAHLVCWYAVGTTDKVVPIGSASGLSHLGDIHTLPRDHLGLPKVRSAKEDPYVLLCRFLAEVEQSARTAPLERAAAVLSYDQRRTVLEHPWVEEQEEHIVIKDAGHPERLNLRIENLSRGGLAQKQFTVCVRLFHLAPPPRQVDFCWYLGRGLLSDAEFGKLAANLGSPEQWSEYLKVERLKVVQDGRHYEYRAPQVDRGKGWVCWTFSAPPEMQEALYERFELEVSTFLARSVGWYRFLASHTVLRKLVVDLEAPFPLVCRPRLGPRTSAPKEQPLADGGCLIQVSAEGPIPYDSDVDWIFKHKPD